MDTDRKLDLLIGAACHEASVGESPPLPDLSGAIYRAARGGGRVPLLKVLLTNTCQNDCAYCANRASSGVQRCSLKPEDLARAFEAMHRRHLVEGLFLSSGLSGDSVRTMDRMLDTVELVRRDYGFSGYVHLKILPGATTDQIERAGLIADRVSVNLEAPNPARLAVIAPDKSFGDLLRVLENVRGLRSARGRFAPAGPTTQFVAGAAGESDSELLTAAGELYRGFGLSRVYYSGFRPIAGSPLQEVPPMAPAREHRLYQADALLRQYGFATDELPFDEGGALPRDLDPKLAWALAHPERFPLELNAAGRDALLRVPGLGPHSVDRILRMRRQAPIRDIGQLRAAGVATVRCAPFILLGGKRPECQMPLPLLAS